MTPTPVDDAARLRAAGLRVTAPRLAVLAAVLDGAGLVRRVELYGSPARYEARVGDNHHHLVCRSCGVVADVDCAVGHAPCLQPANDAGYLVQEADVTYMGICPTCRRDSDSERIPSTSHGTEASA